MRLTTNHNASPTSAEHPLPLPLHIGGVGRLLGGALTWRRAWPGALFLVCLVPLLYRLDVALAGPLQCIATPASTYLLQTFGYPAVAEGHEIVVQDTRVGVAEAFSGLGMLLPFFVISTAVACVIRRPAWERCLMVVSAMPIAIVCNVARVTGTAMVSASVGSEAAHKLSHDLTGWLMMPLAVGLLLIEQWILSRLLIAPPDRDVVPVGSRRTGAMNVMRAMTTTELASRRALAPGPSGG